MLADVLTVAWKDWKETLPWARGQRGTALRLLLIIGIFGVLLPWQNGLRWVTSPEILLFAPYVAFFLVTSISADSFAGERERHTMETLLATRLPDEAVFFGKVTGCLSFGWILTLVSILVGWITVNLTAGQGRFLSYSTPNWLGSLVLSLLGAGLAAGIGALLSMRLGTVKQVQQYMSMAVLFLIFIPVFAMQLLPSGITRAAEDTVMRSGTGSLSVYAGIILLALDLALLAAGMRSFKRHRL